MWRHRCCCCPLVHVDRNRRRRHVLPEPREPFFFRFLIRQVHVKLSIGWRPGFRIGPSPPSLGTPRRRRRKQDVQKWASLFFSINRRRRETGHVHRRPSPLMIIDGRFTFKERPTQTFLQGMWALDFCSIDSDNICQGKEDQMGETYQKEKEKRIDVRAYSWRRRHLNRQWDPHTKKEKGFDLLASWWTGLESHQSWWTRVTKYMDFLLATRLHSFIYSYISTRLNQMSPLPSEIRKIKTYTVYTKHKRYIGLWSH